ncbi:MAG: hypothetical protein JRG74_14135 [Deltaproteobacteria bacterium]|nr:hypothetical protein [Deltaproteobacteria bacterium]
MERTTDLIMNILSVVALTVVVFLCPGCNEQNSPIDQREKVYRALLLDGNRLLEKKKYQKAADLFTEAVSREPEKAEGYLTRGICRFYKGDSKRQDTCHCVCKSRHCIRSSGQTQRSPF